MAILTIEQVKEARRKIGLKAFKKFENNINLKLIREGWPFDIEIPYDVPKELVPGLIASIDDAGYSVIRFRNNENKDCLHLVALRPLTQAELRELCPNHEKGES